MFADDILALLRRFDKDGDAKLSYREFVDSILPININYRTSLSKKSHRRKESDGHQELMKIS